MYSVSGERWKIDSRRTCRRWNWHGAHHTTTVQTVCLSKLSSTCESVTLDSICRDAADDATTSQCHAILKDKQAILTLDLYDATRCRYQRRHSWQRLHSTAHSAVQFSLYIPPTHHHQQLQQTGKCSPAGHGHYEHRCRRIHIVIEYTRFMAFNTTEIRRKSSLKISVLLKTKKGQRFRNVNSDISTQ